MPKLKIKKAIEKTHPVAAILGKKKTRIPFLCVITPVFDPAIESMTKLIKDLKEQTYENFIHVSVSNGASPKIKKLIEKINKKDKRFIYEESEREIVPDHKRLLKNLGKRRDYALLKYDARRYLFLDADMDIVDKEYFAKLFSFHYLTGKDILITNVEYFGQILPIHPVQYGNIGMANFSFSRKKAKAHRYPTDYDKRFGYSNDYRYLEKITGPKETIYLDFVSAKEGTNRSYKRVTELFRTKEKVPKELISVFGNVFSEKDLKNIAQVFESHLVGYGDVVKQFENEFKNLIGFKEAVATNSCTNSFWLLLRALNLKKNEEVVIPNIHFFGIKGVLDLLEIKYTVADVDPVVPNLNVEAVKKVISKKTKAIIALDYGGYPTDIKEIKKYLKKEKREDIVLILDAANSPFTKVGGEYIAREYDFALYSFDMNKILVTGDGGMILSNEKEIMEKCRSLSYYGIVGKANSFSKSAASGKWWELDVGEVSLKQAMNNLTAAIGLAQMDALKENLRKRKEAQKYYLTHLRTLVERKKIFLPPEDKRVENNVYFFWVVAEDEEKRDALASHLLKNKVYTTVKYQPLMKKAVTPNAHDFYARSLCIPLNQVLERDHLEHIVGNIYGFYER